MVTLCSCALDNNSSSSRNGKIPVIFDTDICDDIDDTWALAMLLQSNEFDIKLITTAVGNTPSKVKTVARFLHAVGRTDIPIGIGLQHHDQSHRQDAWAKDYDLSSYTGKIYNDGVKALIDTIMESRRPIKIIAVGPLPNIAAALAREPAIAKKAEFIGMHGSIYLGYGGNSQPSPEYNVRAYVKEAQKVFTAGWNMTITPLDTCGLVQLKDQKYQKVLNRKSPLTHALIENYRAWYKQGILNSQKDISESELTRKVEEKLGSSSSTLFDTVGIYLAMPNTDLVRMKKLKIKVTDDGYTRIDKKGKLINCAVEWNDLGAFEDFLIDRLIK
ncbi:MAG: nucleoside hydrolase [Sedimentisphaerales bacterium]|nr:nucleoside hydrolase [Sedimentisphaerales bacterium]